MSLFSNGFRWLLRKGCSTLRGATTHILRATGWTGHSINSMGHDQHYKQWDWIYRNIRDYYGNKGNDEHYEHCFPRLCVCTCACVCVCVRERVCVSRLEVHPFFYFALNIFFAFHLLIFVWVWTCAIMNVWRSEDNLGKSVLSFHPVAPRDKVQVILFSTQVYFLERRCFSEPGAPWLASLAD